VEIGEFLMVDRNGKQIKLFGYVRFTEHKEVAGFPIGKVLEIRDHLNNKEDYLIAIFTTKIGKETYNAMFFSRMVEFVSDEEAMLIILENA
jgi:hypothetical protein